MISRAALALLLFGCGGARATVEEPSAATPPQSAPGTMTVSYEVVALAPTILLDEPDALRILVHGQRTEVDDREIHRASSVVYGDIAYSQRVGDRWLYLSYDGSLAGSDTFVSPVERLGGPLGGTVLVTSPRASRRLAVRVDGDGQARMLTSSGGAFAPLPTLTARAESVAFATPDVGVVRVVGGALGLTVDGGRHFERVPLDAPVGRLWVDGERFVVERAPTDFRASVVRDLVALDRRGRVSSLSEPPESVRQAIRRRPGAAANARAERLLEADRAAEPHLRVRVRPLQEPIPAELDGCYEEALWDEGRLVRCRHELRYSATGSAPFTSIPQLVADEGGMFPTVSDDGRLIALAEHCGEEPDERTDAVCVIDTSDLSLREIAVGHAGQPAAVNPDAVLVAQNREVQRSGRVFGLDGAERPFPVPREELTSLSYSGGIISATATGARAWAGPLGGELREIRLPDGAAAFAMADAERGIAAGEGPEAIYVTRDGARSFERVAVPIEGDLGSSPREDGGTRVVLTHRVDCRDATRCTITFPRYMLIADVAGFGGELVAPPLHVVGTVSDGRRRLPREARLRTRCELEGSLEQDTVPGNDIPPESRVELLGALGDVEVRASRRDGRITWSGRAPRFRSRSASGQLPDGFDVRVAFAERDLLLAVFCASQCELVRARPGETPEVIGEPFHSSLPAVVGRADEDEILVGVGGQDGALHGFWLDRRGDLRATRIVDAEPIVVEHAESLAFVARSAGRSYVIGREPTLRAPGLDAPLDALAPCTTDEGGAPWAIASASSGSFSMPTGLYTEGAWRLTLRREADSVCVSRAEAQGYPGVLTSGDAGLTGDFHTHSGRRRMTCTVGMRAPD